jgi:hypothetical protein
MLLGTVLTAACRGGPRTESVADTASARADAGADFDAVADSAWISVAGPTIIGFYPIRSNEELERDEDLATVLDDFSYHIGTALDSLTAAGVVVQYQGGDTIWLRSGERRWRFTRAPDSAEVGYLLADATGWQSVSYGLRSYPELYEFADLLRRRTSEPGSRGDP